MDRFLDKTNAPLQRFLELFYKLFYLNVLFVIHTIFGVVVFGFFPSLLALYTLSKRLFHDKEEGLHFFQEYHKAFKRYFIKGNILFVIILFIGGITAMDLVFLYNNYLGAIQVTFVGVFLSLGGLLLGFIVFGLIMIVGIVVAFYPRFELKDILKFTFFTTLTSPLLVGEYVVVGVLSYIVFSVLISVTPFLGASVPVVIMVLLYGRVYFHIFLIQKVKNYSYMNMRYVSDKTAYSDVINSVLSDRDYVDNTTMEQALNSSTIDYLDSIVVLDERKELVAFMLVNRINEKEAFIELLVVKKNHQQNGIGTLLVSHLVEHSPYQSITMRTNKKDYHPSLERLPQVAYLLKQQQFKEIETQTYMFQRSGGNL